MSVANAPFTPVVKDTGEALPLWKDPENIAFAQEMFKYLLIAGLIAYLLLGVVRPILKTLLHPPAGAHPAGTAAGTLGILAGEDEAEAASPAEIDQFAVKLEKAKEIAQHDPKVVANIVKDWLGANGN